jgi:poly(A) polymerase
MNLSQIITREPITKYVRSFARRKKLKLYIVGGYLRDLYLKRKKLNPDIDFALRKNSINFARGLGRYINSGFVVLDRVHGCARLVKKIGNRIITLDFTDFRGKSLKEDLSLRDFTINCLAIDLEKRSELIDYYGGIKDLKSKKIKMVNKKSFDDDPLRILRAFSLASIFGFRIEKKTLSLIKLKKNKLKKVSAERIRDELFKILEDKDSYTYIRQLDNLKILNIIIPQIEIMRGVYQGPYHHLDVWKHSLETLKKLEGVFEETKRNKDIKEYLDEEISSGRKRKELIKISALLHDVGKPKAMRKKDGKIMFHGHEREGIYIIKDILERLRLSNHESELLKKLALFHLRPGYLADMQEPSDRAVFRYFRDTGPEAAGTLLLSLADQRATRGRLTTKQSREQHEEVCFKLIKNYFKKKKEKKLPRLINGNDLINKFKLSPSPLIGKILREIEELQAVGRIKNKKEALKEAQEFIKQNKHKYE